jgi:hypothetical protein
MGTKNKNKIMKLYVYCDSTKINKEGNIPVMIIIKNNKGRFLVNTGLTTKEKFNGREFPKSDKNKTAKTNALGRYLLKIEEICLNYSNLENRELKDKINKEIFSKGNDNEKTLVNYILKYVKKIPNKGTAEIYLRTMRYVLQFDKSATFENVDRDWLERFKLYYANSLKPNTISISLRNIRTVFNRAIDDDITTKYPFRKFKIVSERVAIRDLTAKQIAEFRDCKVSPWLEIYRDLFMLDFYLCGVNAIDLLLCKKLTNGRFVGRRAKTGAMIDLPVEKEAMDIIDKYKGKDWQLSPMDGRADYRSFERIWNDNLKKLDARRKQRIRWEK